VEGKICGVIRVHRVFYHRQLLPYEQLRYAQLLPMFITNTSCLFKLLNNPAGSVSRWCNRNRKLSTATQEAPEEQNILLTSTSDPDAGGN
jgi:hypothetical protein